MAKGKHAAALFEVIHAAKDRQDKSGVLRTPKWWFKNRPETAPQQPPDRTVENDSNASAIHEAEPAGGPAAVNRAQPALRQAQSPLAPSAPRWRSDSWRPASLAHQVTERMSPRTAMIIVASVLVIGSATYVIGRKMGSGPAPANAESLEHLKQGKANADVLKVGAGASATGGVGRTAPISSQVEAAVNAGQSAKPGAEISAAPQAPANPSLPARRVVNLQYVVIQSYPKEPDALAAADALVHGGVPCTIHKGFWPSRPGWFTVVGTTGFERTRDNPEYNTYLSTITAVGKNFAAKSKFRQFEPLLVTWKDASR